jgi:hypothetical protein
MEYYNKLFNTIMSILLCTYIFTGSNIQDACTEINPLLDQLLKKDKTRVKYCTVRSAKEAKTERRRRVRSALKKISSLNLSERKRLLQI